MINNFTAELYYNMLDGFEVSHCMQSVINNPAQFRNKRFVPGEDHIYVATDDQLFIGPAYKRKMVDQNSYKTIATEAGVDPVKLRDTGVFIPGFFRVPFIKSVSKPVHLSYSPIGQTIPQVMGLFVQDEGQGINLQRSGAKARADQFNTLLLAASVFTTNQETSGNPLRFIGNLGILIASAAIGNNQMPIALNEIFIEEFQPDIDYLHYR